MSSAETELCSFVKVPVKGLRMQSLRTDIDVDDIEICCSQCDGKTECLTTFAHQHQRDLALEENRVNAQNRDKNAHSYSIIRRHRGFCADARQHVHVSLGSAVSAFPSSVSS